MDTGRGRLLCTDLYQNIASLNKEEQTYQKIHHGSTLLTSGHAYCSQFLQTEVVLTR